METGRHAEVDIRAEPAILVGVRLRDNETTFDDSLAELQA
ncbi:MAG: hypothetical protein RIR77_1800, partial [Planctomycetota bacterium]